MPEPEHNVGTPPVSESCGNCKYLIQRGAGPKAWYECHYNPPGVEMNPWPRVLTTDWCGQWVVFT